MNTATFISERNCLIPRHRAKKMAAKRQKYLVEAPVSLEEKTYDIQKVSYIDAEDDIAAYWAVVKVSYEI